jgi:hypothetical protein
VPPADSPDPAVASFTDAARLPGQRAHALVTWGLAFHVFAITLLFGPLGFPMGTVRAIASWKELAVASLALWGALRLARGGDRLRVTLADVAAVTMGLAVVARGLVEFGMPNGGSPPVVLLFGARDLGIPFLLYLVGRSTPGILDDPKLLTRLATIGLITTGLAVVERVLPIEALVLAGVPRYYNEFLGVTGFTEGAPYGLPYSYFTDLGPDAFRRAGSVFLSGQGFAVALLLMLPATQVQAMTTRSHGTRWWTVYFVLWAGLLLTVTRMTIIAATFEALVLLVMARRTVAVGALAALGTGLVAVAVVVSKNLREFIWRTLAFDTQSSQSHVADWGDGLVTMWEYPFGAGLATADATAERFGRTPVSADNLLFKYGAELGIPGLIAILVFFLGVLASCVVLARRAPAGSRRAAGGLLTLGVTVGVLVNGATAVVTNLPFFGYLWAWLAGAAVAAASELPRAERVTADAMPLSAPLPAEG